MVEERGWGIINTLPFKTVPKRVIIELVYFLALWINSFPSKVGVSSTYSPQEIFTVQKLDYKKHCQLDFGEYVEVDHGPATYNSM